MRSRSLPGLAACLAAFASLVSVTLVPAPAARASTPLTTLATFTGANGARPGTLLVSDGSGNLFGTTSSDGPNGGGTVFEIARGSTAVTTIASFGGTTGADPSGRMAVDSHGNLFGTAYYGGGPSNDGTVWEVAQGSGTIRTLATFDGTQGWHPTGLVIDRSGDLFGVTASGYSGGGGVYKFGTVWEVPQGGGAVRALATFDGADGRGAGFGVAIDRSGNLFGTTEGGYSAAGVIAYGTVWEVAQGSGTIRTLATFDGTNGYSGSGITIDGSGNLFGTTRAASYNTGVISYGTVWEVAQGGGAITTLAAFNGANGQDPGEVTVDGSGSLYGMTAGADTSATGGSDVYGRVWKIARGSGAITTLGVFNGTNGSNFQGTTDGVTLDSGGNLFGMTYVGGSANDGTVWEIAGPSLALFDANYAFTHADLSDAHAAAFSAGDVAALADGLTTGGHACTGAVADGATKVLLRYVADTPGTVAFTETNPVTGDHLRVISGTGPPDSVATQNVNGQNVAFAVYTAPEALAGLGMTASVTFQAALTPAAGPAEAAVTEPLSLERTPVILIHGLWADPATWDPAQGTRLALENNGFTTFITDYHATNSAAFEDNKDVLLVNPGGISDAYKSYRARGVAITRVDVVGHSMGGLLTRKLAASPTFKCLDNFGMGYVRRLVTVGTPHLGSQVASALQEIVQRPNGEGLQVFGILNASGKTYGLGIRDLQPNSPALLALGATVLPAFAEIGDSTGDDSSLKYMGDVLEKYGYPDVFGGRLSDRIVSVPSETGRLSDTYTHTTQGINHIVETFSASLGQHVLFLLLGPLSDFDAQGFPLPLDLSSHSVAGPVSPATARARQVRALVPRAAPAPFVTVVAPASGQVFQPGDPLIVTVTPNVGTTLASFLVAVGSGKKFLGTVNVTQAPWTASFTIPTTDLGDLPVVVLAQDTAGNTCTASVDTTVQTTSTLVSLSATADYDTLTSVGSTAQITATGAFSDGAARDVTLGSLGTQYAVNDATVAAVSADGLVTALKAGVALITLTNGSAAPATQAISVSPGTPSVLGVSPDAAPPGAAVTLTLSGVDLGGASSVQFLRSGVADPSVTVSDVQVNALGTRLTATLTVSPQAAPGAGVLVVTTPGGVSDALAAFDAAGFTVAPMHVLWTNPDGKTIVWNVSADGSHAVAGTYGPFADDASGRTGYTAVSLSTGPDGVSHLLWSNPDGNTYLWTLQADGSFTPFLYGLMEDDGTANTIWKPVAVSTGGDGRTHLLWSNPDGRTILWDVNAQGGFTIAGNYDPQPGYTASALATGPDGLSHILWNGAGGLALLWDLDANAQPTAFTYGPFSDDGSANTLWSARAVSVGPDNAVHLLWNNPDGRTILWDVDARGGYTIAGNYGPYQDDASGQTSYTAVALATGADGLSHLAWDNADGNSYLWSVQPNGGFTPTFYPPFYDLSSVWKAVAISAAP